jgi:hypothetical protein
MLLVGCAIVGAAGLIAPHALRALGALWGS